MRILITQSGLTKRWPTVQHFVGIGLLVTAFTASADTNLIVNGGFETGDFTGWTVSDASLTSAGAQQPHSGAFEADLGNRSLSTLQQTIPTVAGTTYTVNLWIGRLGLLATGDAFSLAVGFAGTPFVNLTALTLPLNSPYAEYSASIMATSDSSPLIVTYVDQPSYVLIDDISVTAAVPEPAEGLLMLLGLVVVFSLASAARKA